MIPASTSCHLTKQRNLGFTLVELLLAMSLTVLVGGVLYVFQSTGIKTVSRGTTSIAMQSEIRRKLELMVRDLRSSTEVLRITPSSIKVLVYPPPSEDESLGTPKLVAISYEFSKSGTRSVLVRRQEGKDPMTIFDADHIEDQVFYPFYEEELPVDAKRPNFAVFDMHSNDSGQRKRISFIRIRMQVRRKREFVNVVTSVSLRGAHSRLLQPLWNLR